MFRMMSAGGLAAIALAAAFASPAAAAPAAAGARAQARPPAATAASDIALSGVSCADGAHCLAVGQETANPDIGRDFAQAWNGRSWRVLTPPSPGSPAALNGVACTGPAACIAVGTYAGTNGQGHTLAVAWNGTRWRILATPSPGNSELTGIACSRPARCIAVGDTLTTGGRQALAEAWNGTRWRVLPAADTHSTDATLGGISCPRPDSCMATGSRWLPISPGGLTLTLAETWNGTRWQVLPAPSPGTRLSDLVSVSCTSPASCIAAGYDLNYGQPFTKPLAEKWNGTRWQVLPSPSTGRGGSLLAVSCAKAARCIAIGAHIGSSSGGPLAGAWNGTTWRILPTANLGTANANLVSVSCPRADRCTAAGDYFGTAGIARPLTEEWNGDRWRLTSQ